MENRRRFIASSAISLLGAPLLPIPELFSDVLLSAAPVVRQPDQCETFYVRENTPITFHLSQNADKLSVVSFLTEELIPGGGIPEHKHLHSDEFFYFLTGMGHFTIGDSSFPFQAGTTAFIPKDTWHSLRNDGGEKAIFAFGYSPAGFEEFFRQVGTPKGEPYKPKGKAEFDNISKKFGMVFR